MKYLIATLLLAAGAHAADVSAPFGFYPDCVAPSIPMEVHSWWGEPGENHPRHLHLATCAPNSRDLTGSLVSINSPQQLMVRVTAFNQPGTVSWARWSWQSDVKQRVTINKKCQAMPDEMRECEWWVIFTLDPNLSSSGGMKELRLTPNITLNDLGKRQFATLNYQIYLNNGKAPSNYRSKTDPIGRSWYTGFDYANAAVNYMDFFRGVGDLDKIMPTVSGVVPLKIRHQEGGTLVRSQLWQDVDFHRYPEFWQAAQVGVPTEAGTLLYSKPGRFVGTHNWDTRTLQNGVHQLYVETVDTGPTGFNAGALKLHFNVEN